MRAWFCNGRRGSLYPISLPFNIFLLENPRYNLFIKQCRSPAGNARRFENFPDGLYLVEYDSLGKPHSTVDSDAEGDANYSVHLEIFSQWPALPAQVPAEVLTLITRPSLIQQRASFY